MSYLKIGFDPVGSEYFKFNDRCANSFSVAFIMHSNDVRVLFMQKCNVDNSTYTKIWIQFPFGMVWFIDSSTVCIKSACVKLFRLWFYFKNSRYKWRRIFWSFIWKIISKCASNGLSLIYSMIKKRSPCSFDILNNLIQTIFSVSTMRIWIQKKKQKNYIIVYFVLKKIVNRNGWYIYANIFYWFITLFVNILRNTLRVIDWSFRYSRGYTFFFPISTNEIKGSFVHEFPYPLATHESSFLPFLFIYVGRLGTQTVSARLYREITQKPAEKRHSH